MTSQDNARSAEGLATEALLLHHPRVRLRRVGRDWGATNLARVVACVVLFLVTPGAEEAAADIAHILLDGHSFHDEGHEAPDHCCSGAFHFCSCHATVPAIAVLSPTLPRVIAPQLEPACPLAYVAEAPTDPHVREMIRPPAA